MTLETIAVAEIILSQQFDRHVRLETIDTIRNSNRAKVLRCRVADSLSGVPASVVVKQITGAEKEAYDVDLAEGPAARLFNEWAGLQFLEQIAGEAPLAPRFYGGDRERGVVVMEDLGTGARTNDLLWQSDPVAAERGLVQLAEVFGKMHARTVGKKGEYDRIRNRLGPRPDYTQDQIHRWMHDSFKKACSSVAVSLPAGFDEAIWKTVEFYMHPGPFSVYVHGDSFPDNDLLIGNRVKLMDFEYGGFGHALIDGVFVRFHFPYCWRINRLPDATVSRTEEAYRRELSKGCPQAMDDNCFYPAAVEACSYWLVNLFSFVTHDVLLCDDKGGTTVWQKRLLLHLDILAETAKRFGHLEAIGVMAGDIASKLRLLWPKEAQQMPYYPAFTNTRKAAARPVPPKEASSRK